MVGVFGSGVTDEGVDAVDALDALRRNGGVEGMDRSCSVDSITLRSARAAPNGFRMASSSSDSSTGGGGNG